MDADSVTSVFSVLICARPRPGRVSGAIQPALLAVALALTACSSQETQTGPAPGLLPLPSATRSAAAAAPLATPLIIASPTPTSTPVTYVVQAGDTLGGIAYAFGVSVQDLQAANGNVQPEFLSIGQALIVPVPESGPIVNANAPPTPTPVPAAFGTLACYATGTGALYCFVETRNTGDQPLTNVSARITLAGTDGIPLASGIAYSALDVIPPGAGAPLAILFPAVSSEIVAWAVQPMSAAHGAPANHVPLEIVSQASASSGARWEVTGQARNPSTTNAAAAWITLTLYDGAGAILGYRKEPLRGGLAPGAALEFTISAASLGGPIDHISLAAEGRP
jgi:LysM repeat protein